MPIITLTTDFGTRSHYVATMKAIMLKIAENVTLVDVTHNITPHNIFEAAFMIKNTYKYFPVGTIHVVVIDPEVGSDRKPIVVRAPSHTFIGPDNGVFTYIYDDLRDEGFSVYHLTESHYFRSTVSPTFHGRDIFAPAAGWIARGTNPEDVGPKLENYTRIKMPQPALEGNTLSFIVMHIDSFGNAITNLNKRTFDAITQQLGTNKFTIQVGNRTISELSPSYFALHDSGLGAIFGSTNNLEIAYYKKAAFRELNLSLFSPIKMVFG